MKKQFFLSIAIVLSSISTLRSMDLVPQENQKDQSQQFKELNERFNQFIETSKKQKTSDNLTELIQASLELRLFLSDNLKKETKILNKTKDAYKPFGKQAKEKIKDGLWNLDCELSDKDTPEPYNDIKKKLELKKENETKLKILEESGKKLELQNTDEKNEIEKLEQRIVNLKSQLEKTKQKEFNTDRNIKTNNKKIETGIKANNILVGLAQIQQKTLQSQLQDLEDKIKQQETIIYVANMTFKLSNLDKKATLKNEREDAENQISELNKKKEETTLLINKATLHIKDQSTFWLRLPYFLVWSDKAPEEEPKKEEKENPANDEK